MGWMNRSETNEYRNVRRELLDSQEYAAKLLSANRAGSRQLRELRYRLSVAEESAKVADARLTDAVATSARLLNMVAELHKQLGRQPEVVVESILTGITPLLLGYREAVDNSQLAAIETAMGNLDLDNMAGTRGYYPDVEFDESVEDRTKWPVPPDEMQVTTLTGSRTTPTRTPSPSTAPTHQRTNGGVERTDGQKMFQSGSGLTSPPGNEVE